MLSSGEGAAITFGPVELGLLTLAGAAAGWVNTLAGGGSILTVPAMLFLGLPGPVANGTNRIAVLVQSISACIAFSRKGYAAFHHSLKFALTASLGAVAGASLGVNIDGVWFNRLVAATMIGVVIAMAAGEARSEARVRDTRLSPRRLLATHLLLLVAGFWGGLIQIGFGLLIAPILHRVAGIDLVRATVHKVVIALPVSVVALVIFAVSTPIVWEAGVALAIGNAVGAWLAAGAAMEKGAGLVKKALYTAAMLIAVKLVFFP